MKLKAFAAVLAFSFLGCKAPMRESRWFAMDTEFGALFGKGEISGDSALFLLQAETSRLEQHFSDYLPSSHLKRLRGRKGDTLELDRETALLFSVAESLFETSRGRFDITMGPLKRAYGLGSGETHRVPDSAEIARFLAQSRLFRGDTSWDSSHAPFRLVSDGRLLLLRDSLEFDFGALAKGYAVDRLSALLDSLGFAAHLIRAGGDMLCSGRKPKGPWRVGIRHPRQPDSLCGLLRFETSMAVSTSGDYERFFFANGIRYHHIFDPATGAPARPYCAVTVLSRQSRDADGLSTTLFVLGPRKGQELLRRTGAEALWIHENGDGTLCAIQSPGFKRHLASFSIPDCAVHVRAP